MTRLVANLFCLSSNGITTTLGIGLILLFSHFTVYRGQNQEGDNKSLALKAPRITKNVAIRIKHHALDLCLCHPQAPTKCCLSKNNQQRDRNHQCFPPKFLASKSVGQSLFDLPRLFSSLDKSAFAIVCFWGLSTCNLRSLVQTLD